MEENTIGIDIDKLKTALKHCSDGKHHSCDGCPYYTHKERCKAKKDALTVIELLTNPTAPATGKG